MDVSAPLFLWYQAAMLIFLFSLITSVYSDQAVNATNGHKAVIWTKSNGTDLTINPTLKTLMEIHCDGKIVLRGKVIATDKEVGKQVCSSAGLIKE